MRKSLSALSLLLVSALAFAQTFPVQNLQVNGTSTFAGNISGSGVTSLFATPPAIGASAPSTGAFTNLSASGAISGAGATALVSFTQPGTGAVTRTLAAKQAERISVLDYGALCNSNGSTANGHDDTANIQAALTYLGTLGGGTAVIPDTGGSCRTTATIKIPPFVTLEGPNNAQYPFQTGTNNTYLSVDLPSINNWGIDSLTLNSGTPYAYNSVVSGSSPTTEAYNIGIRNLLVRAATGGVIPYGGIRMQGAPGAILENVAITGFGTGLFVNFCFGGHFDVHSNSVYYGVIAWNDVNANSFRVYPTMIVPSSSATVPAGYLPTFMSALNGNLTITPNFLSTNAHYNAPFGLIIGGDVDSSVNDDFQVTIEGFTEGIFLANARAMSFERVYMESSSTMNYGIVSARSTYTMQGVHAFNTTGTMFDLGAGMNAQIVMNGINTYTTFGAGPYTDGSLIQLWGFTASQMHYTGNFLGAQFLSDNSAWIAPTLVNSWANIGGVLQTAVYRKNQYSGDIELGGFLQSGTTGTVAFTLPAGYRPALRRSFAAFGGGTTIPAVVIDPSGTVTLSYGTSGTNISLDGIAFKAEQ